MDGAKALATSLAREGVEVVFGLPGQQVLHALDAINQNKDIRWITVRHEQSAGYMAFGYAYSTGKIGVALVVGGPGALDATAAIGTAYATSTPVLLITGQIESYNIGMHRGAIHELDGQLDVFRPITKWCGRVMKAEEIPGAVRTAMKQMSTGQKLPVELEIPWDLWETKAEIELPDIEQYTPDIPNSEEIKKAAEILNGAKRPLIVCGCGVTSSNASMEVVKLAEELNAPVIVTNEGKGTISNDHYLSIGGHNMWSNPALLQADVILVIGSHLRTSGVSKWKVSEEQKIIQIDIDASQIGSNQKADIGITADARIATALLLKELSGTNASEWQNEELEKIRQDIRKEMEEKVPVETSIINAIHNALGDDDIIVQGISYLGYWCQMAYPSNKPRTHITTSYFVNLGYAFPTALGAKIGNPDKNVVAVCGDGGFLYADAELATAVQEKINVIALVFNDGAYGSVTRMQRKSYGDRLNGTILHNPDFAKLAESFGAVGMKLSHYDELGDAMSKALAADSPVVIEIPVHEMLTWGAHPGA